MNKRLKYSVMTLQVLLNVFELFGADKASEETSIPCAPIAT